MINVFQPSLGPEEAQAVAQVMASNWIGRGRKVAEFEAAWAEHIGVPAGQVRATTCATEGLFQAVALLGLRRGDEVILPANSFVGAANAVLAAGARPVFCDVDERSLNPRGQHIAERLGKETRAILLHHYGGVPVDMAEVIPVIAFRLAKPIYLIEDCACAPASTGSDSRPVGSGADVAIWSFDAMKILSTGDGGLVYLADPELASKFGQLTYLGLTEASGLASAKEDRWWEFGVSVPGRRAIMNDLAAAIGLEQLKKLDSFVARRRQIDGLYRLALAGLEWLTLPPPVPVGLTSSYYAFWLQLERRDELARFLRDRNIYTTFRYYPLNKLPLYGVQAICPNAERAAARTLWLPLHQGLTDSQVDQVCDAVKEFGEQ